MKKGFLVQILLPTAYNDGVPIPNKKLEAVKTTLVEKFGGVTAYTRGPAEGIWAAGPADGTRENIIIVEVMTQTMESDWWGSFRKHLERDLKQHRVVIRALAQHVV